MDSSTHRPFPIPVVAVPLGPGSQPEDEPLDYLPMPQGMDTYRPPSLPEPDVLAGHQAALQALRATHEQLLCWLRGVPTSPIDVSGLAERERALLNQVLGEGEVAAQVIGEPRVSVQESVFAGVWRVVTLEAGRVVRDTIEVGPLPAALLAAAADDDTRPRPAAPALPPDVMNAPSLLTELESEAKLWRPGRPAHVVNLSLLPLSGGDSAYLDARLGSGRVAVLSRGYGNCRITNTRLPRTWRVTYFNSQDIVILDTLEVCTVPEVACAAREDLEDSAERVAEVLDWVGSAA